MHSSGLCLTPPHAAMQKTRMSLPKQLFNLRIRHNDIIIFLYLISFLSSLHLLSADPRLFAVLFPVRRKTATVTLVHPFSSNFSLREFAMICSWMISILREQELFCSLCPPAADLLSSFKRFSLISERNPADIRNLILAFPDIWQPQARSAILQVLRSADGHFSICSTDSPIAKSAVISKPFSLTNVRMRLQFPVFPTSNGIMPSRFTLFFAPSSFFTGFFANRLISFTKTSDAPLS